MTLIRGRLSIPRAGESSEPEPGPEPTSDYIDPANAPLWGQVTPWRIPMRSYMDTMPGATMLTKVGVNLNVTNEGEIKHTLRLLADSGLSRIRTEVGWAALNYSSPTTLTTSSLHQLEWIIAGCKERGIRPLILLNSNHGAPCPYTPLTLEVTEEAAVGATQIKVKSTTGVVLGKSGITYSSVMGYHLFTEIPSAGVLKLSRPLKAAIKVGTLKCNTLLYEPFRPVANGKGEPNPKVEETMLGWLTYVGVVTKKVKELLGSEEFDVEVWNELSFGANFLAINNYYSPALEETGTGNTHSSIWSRTLGYIRAAANEVQNIGVSDGFTNQNNNNLAGPAGTAFGRHPYPGPQNFPAFQEPHAEGLRDAQGNKAWTGNGAEAEIEFYPEFTSWFPECELSEIHTESKILDLAPYTSYIPNKPTEPLDAVGRNVAPTTPLPLDTSGGLEPSGYSKLVEKSGAPAGLLITETGMGQNEGKFPTKFPVPRSQLTAADIWHNQTKYVLRSSLAYINKGLAGLYYFAVTAGDLSLVNKAFLEAANNKKGETVYPGDALGGETMTVMARVAAAFAGSTALAKPRSLAVASWSGGETGIQFKGSTKNAEYEERFPDLTNHDVFTFLPFQINDAGKFVVACYVQTLNMATIYGGTGPTRFDMPAEDFTVAITGFNGEGATITATDPLTGEAVTPTVTSRTGTGATVKLPCTDAPRLLTIQEA